MAAPRWPGLSLALLVLTTPQLAAQRRREETVNPVCNQVLPAVTLERISHRESLQLVPRMSITGAGGTCNYAEDGKKMILLVNLPAPARPGRDPLLPYKRNALYLKNQRDIAHLGDAAFSSGDFDQIVIVKKGNRVITVSAFFDYDPGSRTIRGAYLTGAQVREVAQMIVGKI